jgi:hypothetical protein
MTMNVPQPPSPQDNKLPINWTVIGLDVILTSIILGFFVNQLSNQLHFSLILDILGIVTTLFIFVMIVLFNAHHTKMVLGISVGVNVLLLFLLIFVVVANPFTTATKINKSATTPCCTITSTPTSAFTSTPTLAPNSTVPPTSIPGGPPPTNPPGSSPTATPPPVATPTSLPVATPTPKPSPPPNTGHITFSVPPWGSATNCASGIWQSFVMRNTGTGAVHFHGHSPEFNAEIAPTDGTIAPGGTVSFEMAGTAASGETSVFIGFSFTGNDIVNLSLNEPCTGT